MKILTLKEKVEYGPYKSLYCHAETFWLWGPPEDEASWCIYTYIESAQISLFEALNTKYNYVALGR